MLWGDIGSLDPGIRFLERLSGTSDVNRENTSHSFPTELFTAFRGHGVTIANMDVPGHQVAV